MDLKEYFRETDGAPEVFQEKLRRDASWQWKLLRMYAKPTMGHRKAREYIMTGDTFNGIQAAEMGLVNRAVPLERLREETVVLAKKLLEKNSVVMRTPKNGFKRCRELTWEQNEDYLYAKLDQALYRDPEKGREKGLKQFLDEKSIKPGLQSYKR
jgi:feruloyl-CoA hydratase/lyase